ncbi:3-keto-5-aminohexanoate cleavage protein [Pseudooceanicola sp. CBS1P-1]|uniref:3-keto-5-aminohexanoate cleavage protein n=1 Tax=Pseudooceanicola albus TaxID=2692189 RepID=A0A6L7GEH9_9RHOB|nr:MULTISPECIES: 3-keto-5-aminohexanoate cleavage protein [Pseudooceanicola]MBT9386998.1 3-keto-5-aminohexanoate cleavage protein [Pseudooceanicola endophyticus]MXN21153.1 3-keto-5-aminohexanoate cleavage protein [Pseudooceanicola albus]
MGLPMIMVAPNGARRGRADHPALPVTTGQIADTAVACAAAGADALHLHVRDAEGGHSLDAGRYREALAELASRVPGLRVQITTEAAGIFDVATQLRCLREVQPRWASISVREVARDPDLAPQVYASCAAQGTEVQHILYDAGDIAQLKDWQARGIVRPEQEAVLFVLGRYAPGQVSFPGNLAPFRERLPGVRNWMVCAFGPQEHACLLEAARQGGALRVGFENSLSDHCNRPHPDNAASVRALRTLLESHSA